MTKFNKIATGICAVLMLASAGQSAAETVTSTASAVVQNAFVLAEISALDFGTFRAKNDVAATVEVATLVRPADAALSSSTTNGATGLAAIQSLIEGAPGEYSISGVAGFATLTLTLPLTSVVTLTAAGNPAGVATFAVENFTARKTSGTAGAITLATSVGTFQVDANGDATFAVGASLNTVPTTTTTYSDVPYSGDYIVLVEY
ncbi:MAG: hypothetical protein ACI81A_000971 [Paraglaciecola sp.]|jgi:hypothetical protein